jgi:hypothetical protein
VPNGQLTCYERGPGKKVPQEWNFFCRQEFLCPTISQQAARVMSDDNRKKEEMTAIQSHEVRPGAVPPNASISRKLRDFYDAVQEEGIPDRFLDLLERLEQAEKNAKPVNAK